MDTAASQRVLGGWHLVERLGGRDDVWRATRDGRTRTLFLRSYLVNHSVRLSHPNLATIEFYDSFYTGASSAAPAIDVLSTAVADFVPGPSLEQYVRQRGPLPVERVAEMAVALGGALAAVHQAGIHHGGVMPAAVTLFDADGSPVLWPAWVVLNSDTPYAIPQRRDQPADVYSLAATLVFALTGAPPSPQSKLPGGPLGDALRAALSDDDRPPDAAAFLRLLTPPRAEPLPPPAVVAVDGAGEFRTIGEALRRAGPGRRVLVRPGEYREHLVVSRPVVLAADGPAGSVVVRGSDAALELIAGPSLVRGLVFRCDTGPAVRVRGGEHRLLECVVTESPAGVNAEGGRVTLERCEVRGVGGAGVRVGAARAVLDGCAVVDSLGNGVEVGGGPCEMRGCQVRGGGQSGVYCFDGATATLERCELSGSALACLAAGRRADVTLRDCTLRDGKKSGAYAFESAVVRFERVTFRDNATCGAVVSENARATFTACVVSGNREAGVNAFSHGVMEMLDCDLHDNHLANVMVYRGGEVKATGCKVRDGRQGGVFAWDNGKGTFERCEMSGNQLAGCEVKEGAEVTLRDCTLSHGRGGGLFVWSNGRATVEGGKYSNNRLSGVEVREGGHAELHKLVAEANDGGGLYAADKGHVTARECKFCLNRRANVEIWSGACAALYGSEMSRGRSEGAFCGERAELRLDGCRVTDNAVAGVIVRDGGRVNVSGGEFTGNGGGVFIWPRCEFSAQSLNVHDNKGNGVFATGCKLELARCKINGHPAHAVQADGATTGRVAYCDLSGNGLGAWDRPLFLRWTYRVRRANNRE